MGTFDDGSTLLLYMMRKTKRRSLLTLYVFDAAGSVAVPRTVDELREYVARRLEGFALYRRRVQKVPLGLGNAVWVADEQFDLRNHVYARKVTGAGGWDDLMRDAMTMAEEPRDERRPPWEVILLEQVQTGGEIPPGAVVLAVRLDHVAVDGKAAVAFARRLLPQHEGALPVGGPPVGGRDSVGVLAATVVDLPRRIRDVAVSASAAVRTAWVSRGRATAAQSRFGVTPSDSPTAFATSEQGVRVCDSLTFPLETAKAIRALVPGATVNDVFLAIVAGALRSYLLEFAELPDAPLTCAVPAARTGSDAAADAGNRVTAFMVGLATDEADAVGRLRTITAATAEAKGTLVDGVSTHVTAALSALSAPLLGTLATMSTAGRRGANTVLSNVPRGPHPFCLADARAVRMHSVPFLNEGLSLSHVGTNLEGQLVLSFAADGGALEHPARYKELLTAALDELAAAAAGLTSGSPTRP